MRLVAQIQPDACDQVRVRSALVIEHLEVVGQDILSSQDSMDTSFGSSVGRFEQVRAQAVEETVRT